MTHFISRLMAIGTNASSKSKQRMMGTLTINRNLPELYAVFQAFPRVGIVERACLSVDSSIVKPQPISSASSSVKPSHVFGSSVVKYGVMLIHSISHTLNMVRMSNSHTLSDFIVRRQMYISSTSTSLLLQTTRV